MMEWLAGLTPASPTPTPIRNSNNIIKPVAQPLRRVISENRARQAAIIHLRLYWSESLAMGMPSVA